MLCAQGVAPAAATIERFGELGLDQVPGTGLLASCVPGAFDGWLTLLRDHGTMTLTDVIAPALHYAEHGYPVVPGIAGAIESVQALFEAHWPTSAAVYLPGGSVPVAGTRFGNLALAATYRRLLQTAQAAGGDRERGIEAARACWHTGFVAEAIASFSAGYGRARQLGRAPRGPADRRRPGVVGVDLRVAADVRRRRLDGVQDRALGPGAGVPGAAGAAARVRSGGDRASGRPTYVHTLVECAKLAFADREAWYGDPAFGDVPVGGLLSDDYNAQRRRLVSADASPSCGRAAPAAGCRACRRRCHRDDAGTGDRAGERRADRRADHGHRRADGCCRGARPRRHLSRRCRRPLRQPRLGDAERRLAAELARDPLARLLPRHPGADVHA